MKLVEKNIISENNKFFKEIDKISFLSKNLYNKGNYIIRREFIKTSKEKEAGKIKNANWIRYNQLQKILQESKDPDYCALPRKVSQQVLMQLDKNWKAFFNSIKSFKKNKSSFTGRPKLPRYKDKKNGRNILTYTIQAISKTDLKEFILHPSGTDIRIKIMHNKNVKQARIIPLNNKRYKIELVYEHEIKINKELDKNKIAAVDIGVDNLAAVTSNQKDWKPILINGRPLKSINQYFNKRRAELMSELMKMDATRRTSHKLDDLTFKRNYKIEDGMHKSSRFLIDLLAERKIGVLVIGKNLNWKQECNLGSKTNQSFINIPHAKFIEMLKYKAEMIGMEVIVREEAHTSKCSFLDREEICHHQKYAGRRIKRGLFKSSDGTIINADCNGSGNILRKEFPDAFKKADGIEGVVVRPVRVNIPVNGKPKINFYAHELKKQVA